MFESSDDESEKFSECSEVCLSKSSEIWMITSFNVWCGSIEAFGEIS